MTFVTLSTTGPTATITLDRPDARNAIDAAVLDELFAAVSAAENNPAVRVLVLRSALESVFVAGGDIRAMRAMSLEDGRRFVRAGRSVLGALERSPLPTIAAVNGHALGGGTELALACDIRVCSTAATFGLPEVSLGIFPGWGGTQRLTRAVGPGWARRMVFSGDRVDAATAYQIGLVSEVVEPAALAGAAAGLAERIARNAPIAVRQAKSAMVVAADLPLDHALAFEEEAWLTAFASDDRVEGLSAFLERRSAQWATAGDAP